MKMKFVLLFLLLTLMGCGVSKGKYDEVVAENVKLEQEIDDLANGSPRLFAQIKMAYEATNYAEVKNIYTNFEKRHPNAEEFQDVKNIYTQVIEKEKAEEARLKTIVEKEKKERLASLNKLKKEIDDVAGVTWYYNPYKTHFNNINYTSLYIGKKSGTPWIRLKMSYNGDNWIFFEKAYLSYDGNTIEIPFNEYDDRKSDNSGGYVWEWIDVSINEEQRNFLKEFAKSKDAKMRLSGKYTKTRNLGLNERKGISDVINGYEVLLEEKN